MAITLDWHNDEKNIVKFIFMDPWTTQEFTEVETYIRSEMMTLNHVVDAIFDFSQGSVLPKNALSSFISSARKGESIENEGVTVVVGANALVRMTGNAIRKIIKTETIFFADSFEEAESILASIRENRMLDNPQTP